MSLEYAIEYPCPVRQQITTDQIIEITHTIALLNAVHDATLSTGNMLARVKYTVTTPEGLESREYTVPQLEGEVAEHNRRHAAICLACPVARRLQTGRFGCVGRINYPISALCEEQLAVVARHAWTEQTPAAITIQAMLDARFQQTRSEHTWMGRLRREQRGAERAEPVTLLHRGRRDRLTTDHLLSLLLSTGVVRGNRRRLVAAFLREVRPSFVAFVEKLSVTGVPVMTDWRPWRWLMPLGYRQLSMRTPDESLRQFIAFADTVLLAAELDCVVHLHG